MKNILVAALFSSLFFLACTGQNKELTVGDSIPQFSLKDQNDSLINIKDYVGKKILVIYFYPKDESMVCTKEACTFRDSLPDFTKAGAMVIGMNSGTVASHKEFQQKHNLSFTLLSDTDNKVLKMFGMKSGVVSGRVTFVVDLNGTIVFTFNSLLHGQEHAQKALDFIKQMAKNKAGN